MKSCQTGVTVKVKDFTLGATGCLPFFFFFPIETIGRNKVVRVGVPFLKETTQ